MAAVRIIGPKPLVLSEGHCLILSLPRTTTKQDPDFGKHSVWVTNEQGSTIGLNWAQQAFRCRATWAQQKMGVDEKG